MSSSSECPRCGYNPPPVVNDSTMTSRQEEVFALQAELRCLENSISRLTQARYTVLRKVNSVQPAMRNLPPEVLSTIFQLVLPPIDFDVHRLDLENRNNIFHAQEHFLQVLAAVSHGWRQVTLLTPRLWTYVRLKVDTNSSPLSVKMNMSLLNLHIQYSRNIPMSIELVLGDLPSNEDISSDSDDGSEEERFLEAIRLREHCIKLLEPLRTAIFVDRASTIQDLLLIRPPVEWFRLINKTLSRCRFLTVFQPQPPILGDLWMLDLRNLPCLQHIQLIEWPDPILTPSSISTLYLRKLPLEECIKLLLSCRNLVNFEIVDFTHSQWRGGDLQINESVVFPYLEHFSWGNGSRWSNHKPGVGPLGVLRHIQLPSLHSLVWSDDPDSPANYLASQDLRLLFFSRLPQSLSSLTFIRVSTRSENRTIESLLNSVPQVSELHFVDCSETTIQAAVDAIGRPFSAPEFNADGSPPIVLPNLSKISIIPRGPPKGIRLTKYIPMLEALHEIGEKRKRFQLIIKEKAVWKEDEGVLRRFRVLVKDGFDLEVIVGQRVLDLAWPLDL